MHLGDDDDDPLLLTSASPKKRRRLSSPAHSDRETSYIGTSDAEEQDALAAVDDGYWGSATGRWLATHATAASSTAKRPNSRQTGDILDVEFKIAHPRLVSSVDPYIRYGAHKA